MLQMRYRRTFDIQLGKQWPPTNLHAAQKQNEVERFSLLGQVDQVIDHVTWSLSF